MNSAPTRKVLVMAAKGSSKSSIARKTGHFKGLNDTEIFYQEWAPTSGTVKAGVIIVHGIGEHSGRYAALAKDLVSTGFAVGALDHKGHGQSEGKRVQTNRFDDFADDLDKYESLFRKRYPKPLPIFLLGHSLGGLICLRDLALHKPDVAGVVLSGAAAAKPENISNLTITIGNLLAKVAPDVGVASLELDKISHDPKVVEAYNNDPLVTNAKVRARMGSETLKAMDAAEASLPSINYPILIMHGGDDQITPSHGSEMIAEKIGSDDVTLKIYDGLWHEIYNEPERDEVIADVVAWLNKHLS